jgi:uncharacterized repeat protein (TIGR04138 family)
MLVSQLFLGNIRHASVDETRANCVVDSPGDPAWRNRRQGLAEEPPARRLERCSFPFPGFLNAPMPKLNFEQALRPLLGKDPRYRQEAYHFVRSALDHTRDLLKRECNSRPRHVTGQELLRGIRDLALIEFGPMAPAVFEEWGIRSCADFGEIVFNLIDLEVFRKTARDRREDFCDGYDFFEAFQRPFLPRSRALETLRQDRSVE